MSERENKFTYPGCQHGAVGFCPDCDFKPLKEKVISLQNLTNELSNNFLSLLQLKDFFDNNSNALNKLVYRIDRLESISSSSQKIPHKCPVCDGVGLNCIIGEVRELPIKSDRCNSCEGKGIVWG